MNRSGYIVNALRKAGISAFLPGVHEGICVEPYAVVRQMSGALSGGGGRAVYRIIVLVPQDSPELLDTFAESVTAALGPAASDGLWLSQPRGAVLADDRFKAITTFIEYVSYFS